MDATEDKVLITGAYGMIGGYMRLGFGEENVCTVGRDPECHYHLDLRGNAPVPDLPGFRLVVHCAGSTVEQDAMEINLHGTARLLQAMEKTPPAQFILISSMSVYGVKEGEEITEEHPTCPVSEYGRSKLEAERLVTDWCGRHDVICTILRPAMAFGNGVKGKAMMLFNGIRRGYYVNIRDNDAKHSVVLAYDVARVALMLQGRSGIYNVCDGRNHTVVELANAIGHNISTDKRVYCLPLKWVKILATIADAAQIVLPRSCRHDMRGYVKMLTSTLTFSNSKVCETTGIEFFDTTEVIARICPDYPYIYPIENA